MPTDWRETDERLIRRGELILELSFVENYQAELDAMNHGKEGRPYKLTPTYIQFLTAFRILYSVPYRQLEGFTRALHKLIPQLPPRARAFKDNVLELVKNARDVDDSLLYSRGW